MHNEFTAIIEKDGKWFVAYSLGFLALMDRDEQKVSVLKVFSKR
jgi:hypothetical protein